MSVPWDNAVVNLRRYLYETGIGTSDAVMMCHQFKAKLRGEQVEIEQPLEYALKRFRRIRNGDTKMTLEDLYIISTVLGIDDGDMLFMSVGDFDQKYLRPLRLQKEGKLLVKKYKRKVF